MSKMKIDFVNGGQEFDLPVVSSEGDIQMTIDLMKLQIRVEKEAANELGLDIRDLWKELLKVQADKEQVLSDDVKSWNRIMASQLNLDTVYYVLHGIDPLVTKHQVSTLGGTRLVEIVMAIFSTPGASQ